MAKNSNINITFLKYTYTFFHALRFFKKIFNFKFYMQVCFINKLHVFLKKIHVADK